MTADDVSAGFSSRGAVTILNGNLTTDVLRLGFATNLESNLLISGGSSSAAVSGNTLIGSNGIGVALVNNGATVSATDTWIGSSGTSTGLLAIDNATWTNSGHFNAGFSIGANSVVRVENDGQLYLNSLTPQENRIGYRGSGTLVIADGGVVDTSAGTNSIDLGLFSGSSGTLAIGALADEAPAGAGTLIADTLAFGDGDGTLLFNHTDVSGSYLFDPDVTGSGTIRHEAGYTTLTGDFSSFAGDLELAGGTLITPSDLTLANFTIGGVAEENATFNVDGHEFTVTGDLKVGNSTGSLTITDGTVDTYNLLVGNNSDSTGIVTIDGATASLEVLNSVTVGINGFASLAVQNGGTLSAASGVLTVAEQASSTGVLAMGALSGELAQDTGLIDADTVSFGAGYGTLLFNHTDDTGDYTFDLDVTGSGTIQHEAGYTNLTGDYSSFSGGLKLTGGTLMATSRLSLGTDLSVSGNWTTGLFRDLSLTNGSFATVSGGATLQATQLDTGTGSLVIGDDGRFPAGRDLRHFLQRPDQHRHGFCRAAGRRSSDGSCQQFGRHPGP